MADFTDALRGYAFPVHKRDGFKCRYCGLDGTQSFANWLSLSCDHLLPKGHPNRDNLDYIVTACMFCNTADNRYFDQAEKRGLLFDGLTPNELIVQRLGYVEETRNSYQEFWRAHVHMTKTYRKGGMGAMMDEYERAAGELKNVVGRATLEQYGRIVDPDTKDPDCRSIQTIITHVVRAGYGYADYIRGAFGIPSETPKEHLHGSPNGPGGSGIMVARQEAARKIDGFLRYTAETLEGKWEMTDEEIQGVAMKVRWGPNYDLEQLLEHAIVHILRHRRQIERFLERMGS